MEGAEDSSFPTTTFKPNGFEEDLQRGEVQNSPPSGIGNQLQETSDLCAYEQEFLH